MDKRAKTCCFTGHRLLAANQITVITERLEAVIEKLIEQGVIYYGCGGVIGFDIFAGFTVLRLREKYPQIKLIMVLPCRGQDAKWSADNKARYRELLKGANTLRWLQDDYDDKCMLARNRHLVDNSGVCVAYLKQDRGGTLYTVNYARKKGITVINITKEMNGMLDAKNR